MTQEEMQLTDQQLERVKQELQGKVRATGEYDAIIWKIRAGYVTALYGSAVVFLGTGGADSMLEIVAQPLLAATLVLILMGFSVSGFIIDLSYVRRKLRVVVARDALLKRLWSDLSGDPTLLRLLRLSGEDPELFAVHGTPQSEEVPQHMSSQAPDADEALRSELAAAYKKRRKEGIGISMCLYLLAPTIGLLIFAVAVVP